MQVYNQQNYGQALYGGNYQHQGANYRYSGSIPVGYGARNSYLSTPTSYNQSYNYPFNYNSGTGMYNGSANYYGSPSYYGGYDYQGYEPQKKDCRCSCGDLGGCGQYGISFDRITPKYPRKLGHSFVTSGSNQYQSKGVNHDHVSESAPFQSQRRVTYQPYTRKYFDYQEYIQYVPVQKSYWDYQKVTKQTDFIPKEYYQSKIQYIPQQKLTQKVRYIPIQQQIVHVPQQYMNLKSNERQIQNRVLAEATVRQQVSQIKNVSFRDTLITSDTPNTAIRPAISTVHMVPKSQFVYRNSQPFTNERPVLQTQVAKNIYRNQGNSNVSQSFNGNRIQQSFGLQLNGQSYIKNQRQQIIGQNNMSQSGVRVVQSKFTQQEFAQTRHENRLLGYQQQKQGDSWHNLNKGQSQASLVNQISRQENFR